MKRRQFVQSVAAASIGLPFTPTVGGRRSRHFHRGSFAIDDIRVRFFIPERGKSVKVMVVADTHLFLDDSRGEPYQTYSGRMAKAYNQTLHFKTGQPTNPQESFSNALQRAKQSNVDLLALVGDIFSFPSEAAIEWVQAQLAASGIPYLYVAGNHDWHYEGLPGSLESLRDTWIRKRLLPLYQGKDPMMAAYDIGGVRFLAIDNSHYEIQPAQLTFLRQQIRIGRPMVLMVHIPLYAQGRPLGFGCGHPDWNAKNDRNSELERRPRWAESGHSPTTLAFHREVFSASNLLGIFAGHTHRASTDLVNGLPQFVTDANATGAYMEAEFLFSGSQPG